MAWRSASSRGKTVRSTVDTNTQSQFRLIAELSLLLKEDRLVFWLRGGWALDFYLGQITKSHSDVDLVTWSRNATRIRWLLEAHGYKIERVVELAAVHFSKRGQDIGIAFIAKDGQGRAVTPGREFWPWPDGAFPYRTLRLRGVTCRAMSLGSLLEEKENYEKHARRPLRPKDRESIALLRSLLAAEQEELA